MTKEQQIIQKLVTELEFVAKNPTARAPISSSQYAQALLDFINQDKPEEGKQYLLIGGSDKPSIANGNTWAESGG